LTLPKEDPRTPQELLEIVNVPFSAVTNIQCIHNPGISNPDGQINFIVTVNSVADFVQQQQQIYQSRLIAIFSAFKIRADKSI
jgi:hypothetical protein